jgi:hypothetical protein
MSLRTTQEELRQWRKERPWVLVDHHHPDQRGWGRFTCWQSAVEHVENRPDLLLVRIDCNTCTVEFEVVA